MAKRRLRLPFDSDPKRTAAIDEALGSVRAAAPADDDQPAATSTEQEAEEGAEQASTPEAETKGLPTQGILTPEELAARLGDTDASDDPRTAPEGLKDPTSGFESARERLAGTDLFDTVESDEASSPGKDSSMISEGTGSFFGDMVKGLKGAAEPVKTTEEGEVISTPGQEGVNREFGSAYSGAVIGGLEELLWAERAVDSAGGSGAGSSAGSTGSGGSTGTGSTDTGSAGTGESESQSTGTTEIENEDGSHTTVYDNGDMVTTYPDGTVEHNYADGTIETDYPDGTMKTENPDGSTETIHPDGTVETTEPTEPTDEEETDEEETDEEEADEETDEEETDEEETGEETKDEETEAGGGTEMGGDPDEEGAPLPEEFQQMIDADLAAMKQRLQPVGSGDGVTDPDPNAEPVIAAGPVPDAHAELESMLGQPGGPDDMYGTGTGVDPGSAPGQDSGVIDPGPDADTGVQTMGPEERTTGGSIVGLGPPAAGSTGSEDDSTGDASDSISDLAIQSPLRGVIGPVRLVADDDASEEPPDDADD